MKEEVNKQIHAILLVPGEEDPQELLRGGPCRAVPPTATYKNLGPWKEGYWPPHIRDYLNSYRRALVLAWNGKPVPEGRNTAIERGLPGTPDRWLQLALRETRFYFGGGWLQALHSACMSGLLNYGSYLEDPLLAARVFLIPEKLRPVYLLGLVVAGLGGSSLILLDSTNCEVKI